MKIVLTRLDRVGDLVLSTPAIASVRRSWPAAHVTLVCSRYNRIVAQHNPDIDDLLVLPAGEPAGRFGRRFRGACDLAIALAPQAPDFALVAGTAAPARVGYTYVRRYFARLTARRYLTKLGISEADPELSERDPGRRTRHEVDQVLDLVRLAGGTVLARDLVLPIAAGDREAVARVPANGIALHLGARWFANGSTYASTAELARQLRALGVPLVVTYGPEAAAEAMRFRADGLADDRVGDLSFAQWAAVFEKSRLVLTVDTGATHVASAARRPTVVLFEHRYFHLSSQEWSPYRVPAVCLRKPAGAAAEELAASRADILAAARKLLACPPPAYADHV